MSALAEPRRAPPAPLRRRARRAAAPAAPAARPAVRLLTFSALALYGSLRWATLLAPAATGRMLALWLLAVATGALVGRLPTRLLGVGTAAVALVACFPLAGVPLGLLVHHHVASLASGIGSGLTELPRMLVPYAGANEWARTLIVLGGGLLLLDAAVLLAIVPTGRGDARRAAAALPLIALAIVPYTLQAPHLATLQGLLLFVLVAAFVWGERLRRRQLLPALALAVGAGLAGVALAPGLDIHRPLVNYEAFANAFSPSGTETFDWTQGYGPYYWPAGKQQVLRVAAATPEYWKTENLDTFDGTRWAQATGSIAPTVDAPPATPAPSAAAIARWTETLRVTIAGMYTTDIVAAGAAQAPRDVPGGATPGVSPGTWRAGQTLGPGDAYLVRVYDPEPTPVELAAAGERYPASLAYYRTMFVPTPDTVNVPGTVQFPPFGTRASDVTTAFAASTLTRSPYAAAYRLAARLAAGAATPYAFVERVFRYLQHGYAYDTDAPRVAYPLETFLFRARYGYCQQFAGAMALLLRMGGLPARVAVGFAPGTRSSAGGEWVVRDTDAHAWVEVWFPGYGWVTFDPTPPSTPGPTPAATEARLAGRSASGVLSKLREPATGSGSAHRRRHRGGPAPVAAIVLGVLLGAAALGAATAGVRRRRRGPATSEELVAELERALRRSSIAFAPDTTLAQLERRFRRSPAAVAYLRALARARYAGAGELPSAHERRALRAQLAEGRALGRLRAWWALPPRR